MGWSFRKSKSFGPFRFNFSSSGIGMSFGVKGARISLNKRGTYVNLGANGIYYRQKLSGNRAAYSSPGISQPAVTYAQDQADNDAMNSVTDVGSQSFVNELESKANKVSFLKIFSITAFIGYVIFLMYISQPVLVSKKYKDVFFVYKPNVHIRRAPTTSALSLAMVHQNTKMDIIDPKYDGWAKVYYQHDPDKEGFVRHDMGTIIKEVVNSSYQTRMQFQPGWTTLAAFLTIGIIAGCIYFYFLDKKRMTMVLNYTMDGELRTLHEKFLHYFGEFASSAKVWQQLSATEVIDKRRNSGASQTVTRKLIQAWSNHQLPSPHLHINVSIPFIQLSDRQLYFFPECIIFKKGNQLGGVFYKNISISYSDLKFIEHETLCSDAQVVDHTWEYLNKNGGPDGRFKSNRQLPVCMYSEYAITSEKGWKEVFITSKRGAMNHFADFIKVIGEYQRRLNQ